MFLLIFYLFLFIFNYFLFIVCYHFNFTHLTFMTALNDLTGPSAGSLARIPYFLPSNLTSVNWD